MCNRALAIAFLMCVPYPFAGCTQSGGGTGQQVAQIATTKADLFGVPAEYRALHIGLEKTLARPVAFMAQPGGEAIGTQLEQGNIPYAILTAKEYAAIKDPSKLTLLATAVNLMDRTTRKAHIIIRANSHLKSISDCAGKRFAFGNYHDLLTDYAARRALQDAGVPLNKLLPEILPPPFAMEGRLYVQDDAPSKIMLDLTVNAGVVDEMVFNKLAADGGNPITGPSRDMFTIVGETREIPEMVIVAGPGADPAEAEKLKKYLLTDAKADAKLCEQLGIKGFAEPDRAKYEAVRDLMPAT